MKLQHLLKPDPPWLLRTVLDTPTLVQALSENASQTVVRLLSAERMPTVTDSFRAIGNAFEFPDYANPISASFIECITDLSWLPARAYVLILENSQALLKSEERELDWILDKLNWVAAEWSIPIAEGQEWDRPATGFHVVFCHSLGNQQLLHRGIATLPEVTTD